MFIKSLLALAAVGSALAGPIGNPDTPYNTYMARSLNKRCNAYNKGLPTATGTVTSSKVITVNGGVFDGMFYGDIGDLMLT